MLKFYAKGSGMVAVPGAPRIKGQLPRYVGREPAMVDGRMTFPASAAPFECDENSDVGRELVRQVRQHGELWPADEHTAELCDAKFVAVTVTDGVVNPKPVAAETASRSSRTRSSSTSSDES